MTIDIDRLMVQACENGASDLCIKRGDPPKFCIAGRVEIIQADLTTENDIDAVLGSVLTQEQRTPLDHSRAITFLHATSESSRFRISVFDQFETFNISVRPIPSRIPSLEELGLPSLISENLLKKRKGLVLVTGPESSGKSTTIASVINWINENAGGHIMILEDPAEFVHPHKQAIVGYVNLGFNKTIERSIKLVLRQDPDVIFLGELCDRESAELALYAAEAGRLVYATMRSSIPESIEKIVGFFPRQLQHGVRVQLADNLLAVINQRLKKIDDIRLDRPRQLKGRAASCKVMANSPAIANLIREDKFKQLQASLFGKEGDDPDSTDFDSYYPLSDGPPGPDLNPSLVPTRPGAPDKNSSVALDEPLPEKNDDDAD